MEFAQSSSAAMVAFDHGDVRAAVQLYERALKRGRAMDDAAAIADAAFNLAACEVALARLDPASRHLEEAQYNGAKSGTNTDEIRLLMAKVEYLRERAVDAERIATSLISTSKMPLIRLQAQTLLTLIACDGSQATEAASRLVVLRDMTTRVQNLPSSIAAEVEKAEGVAARLEGRAHEAGEHFDRETAFLRAAHRYHDLVYSLSRSAKMYEASGNVVEAADRYYRAARACVATDDVTRARELAGKAIAMAANAGDPEMKRRIEELITEIPASADR